MMKQPIRIDVSDADVEKLLISKAVTVTVTLPIKVIMFLDDESYLSSASRSKVTTKLIVDGIKFNKVLQIKLKENQHEDLGTLLKKEKP